MKGLLKNIALVLILGLVSITATTVEAKGGYVTTTAEGYIVLVTFQGIESSAAQVALYDADDVELWSDVLTNTAVFRKQFNMASLPDGMYKIILKDGDVTRTQEIKKAIDKVYVVSMKSETLLRPVTNLVKRKLIVSYPEGVSKIESVSFIGDNGVEFFNDEINAYDGIFNKGYVVSKLPIGTYTVAIRTSQNTFYKELTLNSK